MVLLGASDISIFFGHIGLKIITYFTMPWQWRRIRLAGHFGAVLGPQQVLTLTRTDPNSNRTFKQFFRRLVLALNCPEPKRHGAQLSGAQSAAPNWASPLTVHWHSNKITINTEIPNFPSKNGASWSFRALSDERFNRRVFKAVQPPRNRFWNSFYVFLRKRVSNAAFRRLNRFENAAVKTLVWQGP